MLVKAWVRFQQMRRYFLAIRPFSRPGNTEDWGWAADRARRVGASPSGPRYLHSIKALQMEINVELVFKINEAELIRGDATLGSEREVTSDGEVWGGGGESERSEPIGNWADN